MSDDLDQITRKSVPLSHTQSETPKSGTAPAAGKLIWWFGGAVGLALLLAVFLVVPGLVQPDRSAPVTVVNPTGEAAQTAPVSVAPQEDNAPAPFAALQREQARVQDALQGLLDRHRPPTT